MTSKRRLGRSGRALMVAGAVMLGTLVAGVGIVLVGADGGDAADDAATTPIPIGDGEVDLRDPSEERPTRLRIYQVTEVGQHKLIVYPLPARARPFTVVTSYRVHLTCRDRSGRVLLKAAQEWEVNPEATALPHYHQQVPDRRTLAQIDRCTLTGAGSPLEARPEPSALHPLDTPSLPDTPTAPNGTPASARARPAAAGAGFDTQDQR